MRCIIFTIVLFTFASFPIQAQNSVNIECLGNYFASGYYNEIEYDEETGLIYTTNGYGFEILDGNDPFFIEPLGSIATPGLAVDFAVRNEIAYVMDGGLNVISLDRWDRPELIDRIDFDREVYSVEIYEDYLYLAGPENTFYILSIENPSQPRFIQFADYMRIDYEVANHYAYLFSECKMQISNDYLFTASSITTWIWSLEDPEHPELVADVEVPTEDFHNLVICDEYMFVVGKYNREERIISVSIQDVQRPRVAGWLSIEARYHCVRCPVCAYGDFLYMVDFPGMFIVSKENPEDLELVSEFNSFGYYHDIYQSGNLMFVTSRLNGVEVYLLQNPEGPQLIETYNPFTQAHDISVKDDLAAVGMLGGFGAASIADLDNVDIQSYEFMPHRTVHKVYVDTDGRNIFAAGDDLFAYRGDGIQNLEIADSDHLPGFTSGIQSHDSLLAVCTHEDVGDGDHANILLYDKTDPAALELLSGVEIENRTPLDTDLQFAGSLLLVQDRGIQHIYDISEPEEMRLVCDLMGHRFPDFSEFWVESDSLYGISRDFIYVYSLENLHDPRRIRVFLNEEVIENFCYRNDSLVCGIRGITYGISDCAEVTIYDKSNLENWVLLGYTGTPGMASDLMFQDNLLFVADYFSLGIYDVSQALGAPNIKPVIRDYNLLSAYPNPFNSTAVIDYSTPTEAFIRLEIIDTNGKSISLLENGLKSAGAYRQEIDAADWAAGVYFVKLENNRKTRLKKLVLIR